VLTLCLGQLGERPPDEPGVLGQSDLAHADGLPLDEPSGDTGPAALALEGGLAQLGAPLGVGQGGEPVLERQL
jgi:hypothetical protein